MLIYECGPVYSTITMNTINLSRMVVGQDRHGGKILKVIHSYLLAFCFCSNNCCRFSGLKQHIYSLGVL